MTLMAVAAGSVVYRLVIAAALYIGLGPIRHAAGDLVDRDRGAGRPAACGRW